jgi:hypothetical protein
MEVDRTCALARKSTNRFEIPLSVANVGTQFANFVRANCTAGYAEELFVHPDKKLENRERIENRPLCMKLV